MCITIIRSALAKGGAIYASISGGKDSQAMLGALKANQLPVTGLIHAHLGRVEWPETMPHCELLSRKFNCPLSIVRRTDGLGLLEYWRERATRLLGLGIPFWSSAKNRDCTSALKVGPIHNFFTATGQSLIIDAQGLRTAESKARAKKTPLKICEKKSAAFYRGMTAAEAIDKYRPDKKLVITWYPIFNLSTDDVWASQGMNSQLLTYARNLFQSTGIVPSWWPFHPAYVYGNQRVSCRYCILASLGDLETAYRFDSDGLIHELIGLEKLSGYTFRNGFSLKKLLIYPAQVLRPKKKTPKPPQQQKKTLPAPELFGCRAGDD